jgi:hypothetical protein
MRRKLLALAVSASILTSGAGLALAMPASATPSRAKVCGPGTHFDTKLNQCVHGNGRRV